MFRKSTLGALIFTFVLGLPVWADELRGKTSRPICDAFIVKKEGNVIYVDFRRETAHPTAPLAVPSPTMTEAMVKNYLTAIEELNFGTDYFLYEVDALVGGLLVRLESLNMNLGLSEPYAREALADMQFLEGHIDDMYLSAGILQRLAIRNWGYRKAAASVLQKVRKVKKIMEDYLISLGKPDVRH